MENYTNISSYLKMAQVTLKLVGAIEHSVSHSLDGAS
jgi:hypothetical protein